MNPATLEEKKKALTPAAVKKKVAVIGGGIGGMEAARVAALRGHSVTLYEKSGELGGVFIAAAAPSFKEKDKMLIAWYIRQLEKDLAYEAGNRACEKDRQFFQELIASSEPIFTDIYGPKKLLEERKAARNPKLRAATNTSDNVEANITNFHLEGEPSRRLLDFCEKYGISMT